MPTAKPMVLPSPSPPPLPPTPAGQVLLFTIVPCLQTPASQTFQKKLSDSKKNNTRGGRQWSTSTTQGLLEVWPVLQFAPSGLSEVGHVICPFEEKLSVNWTSKRDINNYHLREHKGKWCNRWGCCRGRWRWIWRRIHRYRMQMLCTRRWCSFGSYRWCHCIVR